MHLLPRNGKRAPAGGAVRVGSDLGAAFSAAGVRERPHTPEMRALESRQATAAYVVRVEDALRGIDEPPLLVVGEARFLTGGGVREEEEVVVPDPDGARPRGQGKSSATLRGLVAVSGLVPGHCLELVTLATERVLNVRFGGACPCPFGRNALVGGEPVPDRPAGGVSVEVSDELPVDLEDLDREATKVAEGRVSASSSMRSKMFMRRSSAGRTLNAHRGDQELVIMALRNVGSATSLLARAPVSARTITLLSRCRRCP